ncbi:MAG: hypothetical protein WD941_00415 [Opitutus sp.]
MLRLFPRFAWMVAISWMSTVPLHAEEVEFVRIWPGWRDAESFERIGEYFGRDESQRREVILRTQPEERGGFYFLVRVKSADAVAAARFELHMIRPDWPEPGLFTFPAALPAKQTVFQLGLTGTDWPGGKAASPVAWKLALLAADGRVLAVRKSFLWEKPAK